VHIVAGPELAGAVRPDLEQELDSFEWKLPERRLGVLREHHHFARTFSGSRRDE
jgi:hypothetical protein